MMRYPNPTKPLAAALFVFLAGCVPTGPSPVSELGCSPQLRSEVARGLDRLSIEADVGTFSCTTVVELYVVLEDDEPGFGGLMPARDRQRMRARTILRDLDT